MKITAQLALSQMKVNKKRTIAGIFAIAGVSQSLCKPPN